MSVVLARKPRLASSSWSGLQAKGSECHPGRCGQIRQEYLCRSAVDISDSQVLQGFDKAKINLVAVFGQTLPGSGGKEFTTAFEILISSPSASLNKDISLAIPLVLMSIETFEFYRFATARLPIKRV